jgi:hypothetical protein
MSDSEQLVSALARLALLSPEAEDRAGLLQQLIGTATELLALAGAAVTLVMDGRREVAGATPGELRDVEVVQQDCERGPGVDALRNGEAVAVPDVRLHRSRWPEYAGAAVRYGLPAMVAIPMQLGSARVGALGLYASAPRAWTGADLSVGALLAGMAAGHLVTADRLRHQRQLTDQLQHALTSRIVVEQAKGVIAGTRRTTPEAAYELIRGHARRNRVSVHEVARAIVALGLRL